MPVIRADDLTPAQIKGFRLAENRVSEYATWNNELLTIELEELQDIDFDLDLTGFEDWELDNLLNPLSDDDLEDFFVEEKGKPKEEKKTTCPECGCEF